MHIEIWKGTGKQPWRWHAVSRGRITCSAEGFPSRGNAIRAAKGLVKAVLATYAYDPPMFSAKVAGGVTRLVWR